MEILEEWVSGRGKQPVSWGTLTEVLRDVELGVLAREIEAVKLPSDTELTDFDLSGRDMELGVPASDFEAVKPPSDFDFDPSRRDMELGVPASDFEKLKQILQKNIVEVKRRLASEIEAVDLSDLHYHFPYDYECSDLELSNSKLSDSTSQPTPEL